MQAPRKRRMRSGIWPYLLLAPALIIMLSVVIVPIINAISMSFQSQSRPTWKRAFMQPPISGLRGNAKLTSVFGTQITPKCTIP